MHMQNRYLIGVDLGTQSAKVSIFNLSGRLVAYGQHALRPIQIPAPLLAEHPDDDLWDALVQAFRLALTDYRQKTDGNLHNLLAMGLCTIRCCRVLLKADGTLAYPVISWMDKRLNEPYQYEEAFGDVRYVTTTSGYITHRLTGQFRDTSANHIGWWPMDNDTFEWSKDPARYKECNLKRDMLLDTVKPGEVLGQLSSQAASTIGLYAGMPVVATAHDKAVEALGTGALQKGTALLSLGTYIAAILHGEQNIKQATNFWAFQASIPHRYLYECMGVRRGMWTISWFCDQLAGDLAGAAQRQGLSVAELLNREAAEVPAGCEGLLTVHDWAPPPEATYRKGAFLGLDGRHTRAHMYRSLLEGIALTLKNHVDPMMQELGYPLENLIISGGGAHSDLFMQILADVFGLPARRNQIRDAAALGCVINAGMALGLYDSYEQATAQLIQSDDQFTPQAANTSLYNRLNQDVYQAMHRHLDPLLQSLSSIVD